MDYYSTSGTLNWLAGDATTKYFTVPILLDNQVDPTETVNLALSNPTGNAALGPQATTVLTITPSPSDVWKLTYFGSDANVASIASDTANPANDGIVNLLKYAYALNPNFASTNPFTGGLAGNQFQLKFPRNTSASDITYVLQTSSSLTSWNDLMTYTAAGGWQANLAGVSVSESEVSGVLPDQLIS